MSHDSTLHLVPSKENLNNEHYDIAFENYAITREGYYIVWELVTLHQSDSRDFVFGILCIIISDIIASIYHLWDIPYISIKVHS